MAGRNADVVVIGAGAMGSATAWQLAVRGADVVLLEQFAAGHTRGGSHGASRIFRLSYPQPDYIALATHSQRLWRELEELSGTALLTTTGGISHGRTPDLAVLANALAGADVPFARLTPREAAERWPGLCFEGTVLFHPDAGRLHADHAVATLHTLAAKVGTEVRHGTPVTAITVRGADRVDVHTPDRTYRARAAVVTAGAWTQRLLGGLVPLPPLRVTQEQPAHFAPRRADLYWPAFVHFGRTSAGGVYGLATPGEGVKVGVHGSGPEVDPDRRDFRPEPARLRTLRRYVRDWLPGLDPDDVAPISCTYTTTPTSDFVLDRVGPIVVGAGFSGHGFKFTPAIGRLLADLALGRERPDPRFALR